MPACLAAALTAAFVAQIVWSRAPADLPSAGVVGGMRGRVEPPTVVIKTVPRVIFDRPLFAPRQSAAATSAVAPPFLGGATVAGTLTIRGRTVAVLRRSNGTTSNITIGARIGGWRLAALGAQNAVFVKGSLRRELPYGTQSPQSADMPPSE